MGQALILAVYQTIPLVQLLHDESLHWISISTYNCKEGDVFLIDSMFRGRVAHQTKRQICSILSSNKKELKIVALPVLQQSNAIDCGAFVHSFPAEINIDTYKIRTHLLYCLVEHELSQFSVFQSQFSRSDRNHRKYSQKHFHWLIW